MSFENDFLLGQHDCGKGVPHQSGRSAAYDRGYAAEYEWSAIMDNITGGNHVDNQPA